MAWLLAMIETLYEKYAGVMLCWYALGPLSIVLGVVIWVAGGGFFLGMPTSVFYALFFFLATPWILLFFGGVLSYNLFGLNRPEMSQLGADTVAALLEEVGEPLHYREIHQKLGEPPVARDDADHAKALSILFRNDPRFYSPRGGTYGLVEWRDRKRAADAVVTLLEEAGKPLHHHKIYQKLKDLDLQLAGGSSAQKITLLVRQDPRFYNPGPGTYGLAEWRESKPTANADAVVALLKKTGEPLHYREINQKLEKLGLQLGGEDPARAAVLLAQKDPRLYSPRQNTYGLVEWRERKPAADADTVVALLKEAGEPLRYHEIDQKLDALGFRLSGGGAAKAVNLLVQKDPRLYLLRWDTCGLIEWRESKPAADANIRTADADTVVTLLKATGKPLHYHEIDQKLDALGLRLAGGWAARAMNLLVQEDPRLYLLRWDTYGLAEWQESKSAADANIRSADADTVVTLLKEAGKPLHYHEIDQKLDALGFRLSGGRAAWAVNLLAQKDPRLYLLRWDTCGLAEWRESKPDGAQSALANVERPSRKSKETPASRRREQLGQGSRRYAPLSGPLELTYEVLRAEGRPLHYAQLADRMLATGKWATEAKSPSNTLNSYISKHISRHEDASPFFRVSRGVYGLREWPKDMV